MTHSGTVERAPGHGHARGLGRAGPVALLATVVPITGALATLALAPVLAPWLRSQGGWGVVYFVIGFGLAATLALAPTYTTSAVAGWTFGFARGFPAVVIGSVGGATLCYLGARRLAGQRVQETFRDHPKWEVVRRALLEENPFKTLWIVFLLRLSPVLPFGTTNVLLATTGVRWDIYVLGTLLGLVPRTGLVALAAASAEQVDDISGNRWLLIAGIIATAVGIFVMAAIGRRALERATCGAETRAPAGQD